MNNAFRILKNLRRICPESLILPPRALGLSSDGNAVVLGEHVFIIRPSRKPATDKYEVLRSSPPADAQLQRLGEPLEFEDAAAALGYLAAVYIRFEAEKL